MLATCKDKSTCFFGLVQFIKLPQFRPGKVPGDTPVAPVTVVYEVTLEPGLKSASFGSGGCIFDFHLRDSSSLLRDFSSSTTFSLSFSFAFISSCHQS